MNPNTAPNSGTESGGTPRLLIVNGPPASGKTTLSQTIASDLGLPLLAKDEVKELLFDQLGWSDRDWSKRLGATAWEILWLTIRQLLAGGSSLAVEGNFSSNVAGKRLAELRAVQPLHIVELHCSADRAVLVERFRERALGPDRHPGHNESNPETLEQEFIPRLLGEEDAAIPGVDRLLWIDTTDPSSVDPAAIGQALRNLLWPNGRR